MGFINRQVLPSYRQSVPPQLGQAVPAIFLGMPPLPIGKLLPVKPPWPPKEDKVAATTNIGGIGVGSVTVGQQPTGATHRRSNGKATAKRSGVKANGKQGRNNTQNARAAKAKKKKGNGVSMVRNAGGKFVKKR